MFIVNRKWKFFYLPFLYAIFGAIIGCFYGYTLCMSSWMESCVAAVLAGVYISVPYSLTKRRAFYMACIQALVVCYMKLSRNNRLSPFFVV